MQSPTARLIASIPVADQLGEGPLWSASEQALWWTDIDAACLKRLSWPAGTVEVFPAPARIGSFCFIEGQNDWLLCAFDCGFGLFAPRSGAIRWLDRPAALGNGVRMNDGRTDPAGRFYSGSMLDPVTGASLGSLYRLTEQGRAEALFDGVGIANSLCWSPNGRHMYFADSLQGTIQRASYEVGTGEPGEFTEFARVSGGAPDGSVTDARGCLWTAIWGAGRVDCRSAAGELLYSLPVPAAQVTCPSFGPAFGPSIDGGDGNLLFVTSASKGLDMDKYPEAGSLFVFETNCRGTPAVPARLEASLFF